MAMVIGWCVIPTSVSSRSSTLSAVAPLSLPARPSALLPTTPLPLPLLLLLDLDRKMVLLLWNRPCPFLPAPRMALLVHRRQAIPLVILVISVITIMVGAVVVVTTIATSRPEQQHTKGAGQVESDQGARQSISPIHPSIQGMCGGG